MGTPLGPKYVPYTYMDPLGYIPTYYMADKTAQAQGRSMARNQEASVGPMVRSLETTDGLRI